MILDIVVGIFYEKLYFSEKSRRQDRLIHSALETNEDVLIFGSSRAYYHYNPKIIEDSLGLTCYNVGYGGQSIYFHLALLKSALERYNPKIAIIDLMTYDFEGFARNDENEKLGILLPFSRKSDAIHDAVLLRGWQEDIKLLSSIYPMNSKQLYMLRNNFATVTNHYKGFTGLDRVWTKKNEKKYYDNSQEIDPKKVDALYEFIDICRDNHIEMYIFVSPHFVIKNGVNQFETIDTELSNKYGIMIHNFESDSLFLEHPEYFADPLHLNKNGANKFTSLVVKIIKANHPK